MILPIVTFPDPILKQVSLPVARDKINDSLRVFIRNMFETMYAAPGVGLAAVQVGVLKRILVVDVGKMVDEHNEHDPRVLINPEISTKEGRINWEEGCLSLPGFTLPVERYQKITLSGLDEWANPVRIEGIDLLAVALQHEMDHLNGILLVDRISNIKRDLYRKKCLKAKSTPEK